MDTYDIESRKDKALKKEQVFDFLLKKKVFRAGITLKCNKCELKSWVGLNSLSESVECSLCGNKIPLLHNNSIGVNWHFRRTGLFGETIDQEGAIPVLLTLLQLIRVGRDFKIFPNYNLIMNDACCELDIIAYSNGHFSHHGDYDIIIGECKSPGLREEEDVRTISVEQKSQYQVVDKDIENMVKVKKVLDSCGFNAHLLFSTTANKFSVDEIGRFKELTKSHIHPILFTANELEPYMVYERYKENTLPEPHAITLDHLGFNSEFIYLTDRDPSTLLK